MQNEIGIIRQSVPLTIPDGGIGNARMNRRSELVIEDFITQSALDGRLFVASAGALTTPVTWGATATIDVTKPAIWGLVPAGVTIIPIMIVLYMEAFGTSAQFECDARVGTGGARTSGGTAVTPTNMRTDAPNASSCTWYQGDNTPVFVGPTTNISRFWRDGQQFAITKSSASATASSQDLNKFVWKLTDSLTMPVVVGSSTSTLQVDQGSQAGTGFCDVYYIELPTAMVI